MGTLAAFGGLCVLWVIFGSWLPGAEGWVLVRYGHAEEEKFWRIKWLRALGLLNCPVLMVAEPEMTETEEAEICSPEDLLSRLMEERNRGNGTGTGDPSGRDQRRGISEL